MNEDGYATPEDWEDVAGRALCTLQESLAGVAEALSRLAEERSTLRAEVERLRSVEAAADHERRRHVRLADELSELAGSVSSLVAGVVAGGRGDAGSNPEETPAPTAGW